MRQAAEMVRVHVGQVDLIHLLRLVTRRAQVIRQLAQAVAQQLAGAAVDHHQLIAGIDQIGIDRGDHRQALMPLGQPGGDLLRRGV